MTLGEVAVIIPAYNEEPSLPFVLRDLPPVGLVIVVDNGSTDRTAAVARKGGAVVVEEPRRGYGSACLAGLTELQRRRSAGYRAIRVVAFVDADYSDHPEQLMELVDPIFANRADLVIGSRIAGDRERGAMPPQSLYGNRLACGLMRVFFGAHYTDLGPFRAIAFRQLRELQMNDTNFGWTVEMQIKAAKMGLRTMEVPVRYRKRIGVSKISGTLRGTLLAGTKILYTIAKYSMWRRQTRRPTTETSHVTGHGTVLTCDSTDGAES